MSPDLLNGLFELAGAALTFSNVRRVMRDGGYAGVNVSVIAFFTAWGLWNCFYYPHLGQWLSTGGGVIMVTANLTWIATLRHYGPLVKG